MGQRIKEKLQQEAPVTDKEKLKQNELQEFEDKVKQGNSIWKQYPAIRYTVYAGIGLGVLWGSKYLFALMADNIRAFKDLTKSIKE